jgi:GNAT superfamily N-acetyltransferase
MNMRISSERLSASDYIAFLKETDLGSQYPRERFDERIEKLVRNASISLTARNDDRELVGVCLGITDFAYWLFITDLGVSREYTGQGIGRALMARALETAGGEKDIVMYTCANAKAIPFYDKIGMTPASDVMEYNRIEWTSFTVK